MLKEEDELRDKIYELCRWAQVKPEAYLGKIKILIRAIREDCAKVEKVAENWNDPNAKKPPETGHAEAAEGALCARKWKVALTCCGHADGVVSAETWEEADKIRNAYTSGVGVNEHGYSAHESESGHRRSAVIEHAPCPHEDLWKLEREAPAATETEAKRLREALDIACDRVTWAEGSISLALQDELRRRAGGK